MEVEIIKANNPFDESSKVRKVDRLRVAAYCRVSTDDEDQIKSYNSMVKHYTELIQNNEQWVFAGVYADKAITGTKVDKREDFQRLIQDCMDGKIEIYLYVSVAPIPAATVTNREWGTIGTNYLKGLVALAFQGFFIMVCVAIYAVLVASVAVAGNLHSALWSVAAYTVILCFSLFKTGSLSKSIFNAH